jgi:hypothetical protein
MGEPEPGEDFLEGRFKGEGRQGGTWGVDGLKKGAQFLSKLSTALAQKVSLAEMPSTSWVLKRTVQRP